MSATVADRVLERLREWGVEQVFGYPGDGINGMLGAFSRADDQDAHRLKDHTVTLAELLTSHTEGWQPPEAHGAPKALAQVHCHQHAVLGWDADRDLLERVGVDVERLDSGCCGLAGNFGFTAGHGEVSRALAEQTLLPRIREADDGTAVLADGFSCRTQIHQLDSGGHEGHHLAELLAAHLDRPHDERPHEGSNR